MTTLAATAPVIDTASLSPSPAITAATPAQTPAQPSTTEQAGWLAGVPEELRSDPTLQRYKDLPSALKGFIETKKMVGEGPVRVPAKDAPQEKWDEFYKAKGCPDKPEDYQWPTEGLPDGVTITDGDRAEIGKMAKTLGLNPTEAARMYRGYAQRVAEVVEANAKARQEYEQSNEQALREEWGQAYDSRMKMAQDAVKKFGGEDLLKMAQDMGFIKDARFLKAFGNIAKVTMEDEVRGAGPGSVKVLTPVEAERAANKFGTDNRKALMDAGHPDHETAMSRWRELTRMSMPDTQEN